MAKKEKQAESKTGLVEFKTIKDRIEAARKKHTEWYEGPTGQVKTAYDYYNTLQTPQGFPESEKIFCQLNKIKESTDTQMGIMLSADPDWEVTGRGRDFKDRERSKVVKATMKYVANESGLFQVLYNALLNYLLPGLAAVRVRWDPHKLTSMDTLGMLEYESLPLDGIRLDPRALHPDKGRFVAYERYVTKDEFGEEWGDWYQNQYGKKLDVDEIFNVATQHGGIDYDKNLKLVKEEQVISIIQYEYWRKMNILLKDPQSGEVITDDEGKAVYVPKKQYQIALAAGDRVFRDDENPLSALDMWTIIFFYNSPILESPYSQGDFPAQRAIQDLINTWFSMLLQDHAKTLATKLIAYTGSIKNKDQLTKSEEPVIEWNAEALDPNLNPNYAIPHYLQRPEIDVGSFRLLEMLLANFESVSPKNIIKGDEPTQVKSGRAISLLQNMGLQPSHFHKKKLASALLRLGQSSWELIKQNMTDEMELPIMGESGEPDGVKINKIISPDVVFAMDEVIKLGQEMPSINEIGQVFPQAMDLENMKKEYSMITVRDGEDRLTIEEFLKGQGARHEEMRGAVESRKKKSKANLEFVYNDLSFGNFNVKLTIDPQAEQSRLEKMQRVQMFMPAMQQVGAPMTAIDYGLDAVEEPDRHELMKKIKDESELFKTMQVLKDQGVQGGQNVH